MRGRLNLFQAAMLRWRELHPYNAVHVAELPLPFDAARLQRAIAEHVTEQGLTGLVLDVASRRFEYRGGPAHPDLTIVAPGPDPEAALDVEMSRQLNLPFPVSGGFDPFRFFALPGATTFYLGIAYDHFIAGGDSIVVLLKGIAARYAGTAIASSPPDVHPRGYAKLFLRNALAFYFGQFWLPAMILRARRSIRPRYPYGDAGENAYVSLAVAPAAYVAIKRTANAWGVTQNDLMVAMLLKAVAPEIEGRDMHQRRHEIAIASVFNIRREVAPGPERAFGQFLSSFLVSHPMPAGMHLREVATDIHAQTQRIKRRKLYLQTLYAIAFGGLAWRYMQPHQRKQMYAKNYPVWAGMTMLNVDNLWRDAPGTAAITRYLRAGSTGPFSPLVVTPAAVGDNLRIGISYRTAAFRRDDVVRIGAALVACADSL
ncbi:MAG: hypothetical protein ABI777_06605 [Betaproteobacteria bacterium]